MSPVCCSCPGTASGPREQRRARSGPGPPIPAEAEVAGERRSRAGPSALAGGPRPARPGRERFSAASLGESSRVTRTDPSPARGRPPGLGSCAGRGRRGAGKGRGRAQPAGGGCGPPAPRDWAAGSAFRAKGARRVPQGCPGPRRCSARCRLSARVPGRAGVDPPCQPGRGVGGCHTSSSLSTGLLLASQRNPTR